MTQKAVQDALAARDAAYKYRCPDCAEPVREDARICRSCRAELSAFFQKIRDEEAVQRAARAAEDASSRAREREIEEKRAQQTIARRNARSHFMKSTKGRWISSGIVVIVGFAFIAFITPIASYIVAERRYQDQMQNLEIQRSQAESNALNATLTWGQNLTQCGAQNQIEPFVEFDKTSAKYGVVYVRVYGFEQTEFVTCFGEKVGFDHQALSDFFDNRRSIQVGEIALSQWGAVGYMFKWEDPNRSQ